MTKFKCTATVAKLGIVQHVIRAKDRKAAQTRFLRAHPNRVIGSITIRKLEQGQ